MSASTTTVDARTANTGRAMLAFNRSAVRQPASRYIAGNMPSSGNITTRCGENGASTVKTDPSSNDSQSQTVTRKYAGSPRRQVKAATPTTNNAPVHGSSSGAG